MEYLKVAIQCKKCIDQLYNTTKKKAEAQLKRLQGLGAEFSKEMLPSSKDLIDMAEGFYKKTRRNE